MDLKGRIAIVTGAAVGIGQSCAERFAKEGCGVAVVDMDAEKLAAVAEKCRAMGADVLTFVCDVADEAAVKNVVAETYAHFGKIDILVNNAGIWRRWKPFVETTSDEWKQYIGVNILGVMYFTHEVLPHMLAAGYGRIINVASVAGVYGNANMADYSMTKGGVIAFTKAIAKEVTAKGILVNAVSPGSVSHAQEGWEPSKLSFMGRTGTHEENANVIAFLASDEASYVSGQNIQIDGCRLKQ